MTRRMSCSMTVDAVRDRTKTVTRRHVDTWKNLKPGDRLTLIEKGMGLPKGAKQVVLAEVEVVSNCVEPIGAVTDIDVSREGFPGSGSEWFIRFWLLSYCPKALQWSEINQSYWVLDYSTPCRRIEWRYL